jgi:hypothetical protein
MYGSKIILCGEAANRLHWHVFEKTGDHVQVCSCRVNSVFTSYSASVLILGGVVIVQQDLPGYIVLIRTENYTPCKHSIHHCEV